MWDGGVCQMQGVIFVNMALVLHYVKLRCIVYGKLINNKVPPQNEIITKCTNQSFSKYLYCISNCVTHFLHKSYKCLIKTNKESK